MAKPRINIDAEQFQKLCALQCTLAEIAGYFDCSPDTIERFCDRTYKLKFNEVFEYYSANGRASLRRMQYKVAMQGNVTMLIWLGKQYLGQTDQIQPQMDGKIELVLTKKYAEKPTA